RQCATGALILEIPGENRSAQADLLAGRLREILADRARVNRLQKLGEIRLRGLEISTTENEAPECIAKEGGCNTTTKTGRIMTTIGGIRFLWVQCPLMAAKKAVKKGVLTIGWTQVRVELLDARPLQCFKCLERGHVQSNCNSDIDRRQNCYRCGEKGHLAQDCEA
ncbi:Gag-Pol polyprotein, partial [Harpegnathos saltator]